MTSLIARQDSQRIGHTTSKKVVEHKILQSQLSLSNFGEVMSYTFWVQLISNFACDWELYEIGKLECVSIYGDICRKPQS